MSSLMSLKIHLLSLKPMYSTVRGDCIALSNFNHYHKFRIGWCSSNGDAVNRAFLRFLCYHMVSNKCLLRVIYNFCGVQQKWRAICSRSDLSSEGVISVLALLVLQYILYNIHKPLVFTRVKTVKWRSLVVGKFYHEGVQHKLPINFSWTIMWFGMFRYHLIIVMCHCAVVKEHSTLPQSEETHM